MAYTTSEARRELLDTVAQAANELGFASACLAEAYEWLDEYHGDPLAAECFRPVAAFRN
jgi:class 3 adenylate cyclase